MLFLSFLTTNTLSSSSSSYLPLFCVLARTFLGSRLDDDDDDDSSLSSQVVVAF